MALPSIASQMPIQFRNGARWECFNGQCKGCSRDIAPARVTGRLTRLVDSVVTVEAVGVCAPCKLVTSFHYRLHDSMRITGKTDAGWALWKARPSIFDRMRAFIARTVD